MINKKKIEIEIDDYSMATEKEIEGLMGRLLISSMKQNPSNDELFEIAVLFIETYYAFKESEGEARC